jgi:type III pantothenate kinase
VRGHRLVRGLPTSRVTGPDPLELDPEVSAAAAGALVLVASTNQTRLPELRRQLEGAGAVVRVAGAGLPVQLPTRYRDPRECGLDRLLGALAAHERGAAPRPAVVIDAGTAVTIDGISVEGQFLGGMILPGLDLCLQALAASTALPRVHLRDLEPPPPVLGRSTAECLAAGGRHALVAGLQAAVGWVGAEVGGDPALVVSGHDGEWLARLWPDAELAPDLVLEGLSRAFARWG